VAGRLRLLREGLQRAERDRKVGEALFIFRLLLFFSLFGAAARTRWDSRIAFVLFRVAQHKKGYFVAKSETSLELSKALLVAVASLKIKSITATLMSNPGVG
jgi:hypothetical protein